MKVLVLTHHRIPNNLNGAVTRIRNLAQQLARRGAKVTIISYISPRQSVIAPYALTPGCNYFERRNQLQWMDGLASRWGLPPYSLTTFLNACLPIGEKEKDTFDIIISESPLLWQIARRLKSRFKVLSAHNYEAAYHDGFSHWALAFLRCNEAQAVREADAIISVASEDQVVFQTMNPHVPIHIIPNGFQRCSSIEGNKEMMKAHLKAEWGIPAEHRVAIYLASNSVHNVRGLAALSDLFSSPQMKKRWTLMVVGNVQNHQSASKNMIFCGPRRKLSPFFQISDLALNPVFSGSGSNVKLMEYLGYGLPVLTTPFGVRGYDRSLKGLHIENLEHFENRMLSEASWNSPDPNTLVPYEWDSLGKQLFDIFTSLLQPGYANR